MHEHTCFCDYAAIAAQVSSIIGCLTLSLWSFMAPLKNTPCLNLQSWLACLWSVVGTYSTCSYCSWATKFNSVWSRGNGIVACTLQTWGNSETVVVESVLFILSNVILGANVILSISLSQQANLIALLCSTIQFLMLETLSCFRKLFFQLWVMANSKQTLLKK